MIESSAASKESANGYKFKEIFFEIFRVDVDESSSQVDSIEDKLAESKEYGEDERNCLAGTSELDLKVIDLNEANYSSIFL